MRHYTVIDILSEEHGGLTRAAFRRSTALRSLGETVEVLCFNLIPDFKTMAEHIRTTSEIGDVPLSNFFHDLIYNDSAITAEGAARAKLSAAPDPFYPIDGLTVEDERFSTPTQSYRLRNYVDESNTVTRVDFIDRDEKLFFVDERKANTKRPRRMTFIERRSGVPIYQGGNYAFREAWIDSMIGEDEVALGIDAASLATALRGYTRPNVQKNYFIHSLHTATGEDPITGAIRPDRVETFRSHRTLDNIISLTRSQARHIQERLDPACEVRVLPNVIPQATEAGLDRDPNLCVIVSRISEAQKRLTLWLQAFSKALETNPKLRAEVFGGPLAGESWDKLTRTIDELGLNEKVTFHGHTDDAASQFSRAGFTALTSREEGFGMTLVEAMRRGTVPISFDINYGPSDIITDGVDGFLVANGDVDGMAEAMVRSSRNGPEITAMREAAVTSAERFSPDVIGRAYREIVEDTRAVSGERRNLAAARVTVERIVSDSKGQSIVVKGVWPNGDSPRLTGVELVATDHHTVLTRTVSANRVDNLPDGVEASFTIVPGLFKGLGRKDITGWVRLRGARGTYDLRPAWPDTWVSRPGLSPSNQFNLR